MSKCKRALSLLLVMLMVLSLVPVSAFAADEKDTYSIVINYVFKESGQTAAPSWTASVSNGSSLTQDVTSPAVVGYTPDQDVVHLNYTNIKEDKTITVAYSPALVNFTVRHYLQNVDDDKYTLAKTETKQGYTETAVGDALKDTTQYDGHGFTALLYDTTTKIAADGSTVVEIYYDRNYYLLSLALDGGYGADPVYARYGAPISVADPTKPGYTFDGWNPTKPDTMPAENRTLTAQWKPEDAVNYTVAFWYENADDAEYSYAGSVTQSAAAGTSVSSGDFRNTNFTGRDADHFTYDSTQAETVTVAGDGSTVVNVYFSRNTYTLTFREFTCTNSWPWHSHSDSCYTTRATITAKWNAKISDEFSKAPFNTTYNGRAWECTDENKYSYALQTLDRMPGFDATFNLYDQSTKTKKTIYYYVQKVGATVDSAKWPTSAANFDLLKQVDTYFSYATYNEEYHEIQGFTRYTAQVAGFTAQNNTRKDFSNNQLLLYYLRNSYTLKFYNHDTEVTNRQASVQYEAPLGGYDFVPDYPAGLEPNAYEFGGWYLNPECTGEEYKLDEHTMPASDLMLYAKWTPKTHTVRTFLTEDAVSTGTPINTWENVAHRSAIDEPAAPENGSYVFVGWFYKENGVEKAFDFSMAITKDMDLYAKWSSNVLVKYTIKYQLEDDTTIADDTEGSALAGTTKTFDAKGGDELYPNYREGYFPLTASHSLEMKAEGGNEWIFVYVQREAVPYTVKYVDAATGVELIDAKYVADNRNAIVTEKYAVISGYMPDAAYKRLVVSADEPEKNVITFYYTKDTQHALVTINYWTQTPDGNTYGEYSTTTSTGDIGTTYSETPKEIEGFTYVENPANPLAGHPALASGELTANGLELNLYYDRNSYEYTVRYVDADNNNTDIDVSENVTGIALFGAMVTGNQKQFPGYMPADNEPAQKQITIGTGTNEIIFYYYKCFYVGHVQTTLKTTDTIRLMGSNYSLTDAVTSGYLYGGAFEDQDCQTVYPFDNQTGLSFTPEKGKTYYIWEVNQKYLVPKTTSVWAMVDGKQTVTKLYLMTVIDRLLYSKVGFIKDGADRLSESNGADVAYGTVQATKNGALFSELYVENGELKVTNGAAPESRDAGYIGVYKLTAEEFAALKDGTNTTFKPFWVTLDGVKVTGVQQRTCEYVAPAATKVKSTNQDAASTQTPYTEASTQSLTFIATYSYDATPNGTDTPEPPVDPVDPIDPVDPVDPIDPVAPVDPVEPTDPVEPPVENGVVVTVNDNDSVYEVAAQPGDDLTGQISYAGASGKLFAGWFTDESYTLPANLSSVQESMTIYAKYVSDAFLRFKFVQQRWIGSEVFLFTAIDSYDYDEVGFIVNGEMTSADYIGSQYSMYSARALFGSNVGRNAKLVVGSCSIGDMSRGDSLTITPYWVTLDGTTVYGTERTLTYGRFGLEG